MAVNSPGLQSLGAVPSDDAAADLRQIWFNDTPKNSTHRSSHGYANNVVSTGKYTVLTFIPKTLFEFFRIVANVYFLVISILQVSTDLSPTNQYTTITPLTIVLVITMIKQGMEDWKRHRADTEMNNRRTKIVGSDGSMKEVAWRDVVVGDIVVVEDRQELPADIIVLATSEEDAKCFTETANLDGETNLKRREAVKSIAHMVGYRNLGDPEMLIETVISRASSVKGRTVCELPNNRLYTFEGSIQLQGQAEVPVGPENVILRGCMLRSCKTILGLVVFTGNDTKIMRNQRPTPSKQSNVYQMVNRCIFLIFITQFVLCMSSSIAFGVWSKAREGAGYWFLGNVLQEVSVSEIVTSFFTFLILYNNLVPISLYVSLDIIKVLQAKFIEKDTNMLYVAEDGERKFAKARTSDLNEDLGQIEYIFSDKTGTLTRNLMEFRKCSIGGVAYGFGTTEIGAAALKRGAGAVAKQIPGILSPRDQAAYADPHAAQVKYDPKMNFDDPRLIQHLREGRPNAPMIDEFLTLLSVCHTVIPEVDHSTGTVAYRSASPDEEALVKFAKCMGFDFKTPVPIVDVHRTACPPEETLRYEILNVNEFNSTRKRMSVIVRCPDGTIKLYCKGADNVMFERSSTEEAGGDEVLSSHLTAFASEGLRTLVCAFKVLTAQEYEDWSAVYTAAATAVGGRSEKLAEAAEAIEVGMTVIGATAIEDKLQVGVPDAIASLAEAGLKIWVLTGDKEETAINIGFACRLLTNSMNLVYVNQSDRDELADNLRSLLADNSVLSCISENRCSENLALIIDGKALTIIFSTPGLALDLLKLAKCCKAVVACRVSPSQKAQIVDLVRRNVSPTPLTLAIGDGANDVNMIQTAHVGVGISGQEGVQAVNSSDYAIAQFRFLKHLLLIHGRMNYSRIAKVILYSFYKNIALVLTLYLFNFYNGFSGTTLFESFVMAGWNFFLALPIIVVGISDYDVSPLASLANPALYISGQWKRDLNVKRFVQWILNAFVHAILVFFLPLSTLTCVWDPDGSSDGLNVLGTAIYSCLLMVMNYKVALITLRWNRWFRICLFGSILAYFIFLCIWNTLFAPVVNPPFFYAAFAMFTRPTFWFLLILVPIVCIAFDVVLKAYTTLAVPTPNQVLREVELGKHKTIPPFPWHDPTSDKESLPRVSVRPRAAPSSAAVYPSGSGPKGVTVQPRSGSGVADDASGTTHRLGDNAGQHTGFDYNAPEAESYFAHPISRNRLLDAEQKQPRV